VFPYDVLCRVEICPSVLPHELRTPSDIPVQSDPSTLDDMLIFFAPVTLNRAGDTRARKVHYTLKYGKQKIKGPTLRIHSRMAITSPNIMGTKQFEAASKVM